ncbi:hypothetical protein [Prosthecobacter sp.]|uniref:hypothetical protein n=1 Tax=Prosthecobacter sp. TaxID=1965333 RepID=UPI002AB8A106|nr:hypothetical protein [Prosthecobacter sp.]MDZ4402257.1 hypothetical protein [Prosthecobacter sp.]
MKRKLLTAVGALLLATGLSSCYVYDDPLTWGNPYGSPVYRPSYYPRSYSYPSRSYGYSSYRSHSHCAPTPPVCRSGYSGGYGGGHGHSRHGWH